MERIDILETAEWEPYDIGTKTNEGAAAQAEGRADDAGVATWKTFFSHIRDRLVDLESS